MAIKFANLALAAGLAALVAIPTSAEAQRKGGRGASSPTAEDKAFTEMMEAREAAARTKAPWYFETPSLGRFRSANQSALLAEEHFALNGLGWALISNNLTDRGGMFPQYQAFLGITADGRLEGVLFPSSMDQMVGENVSNRALNNLTALAIQMADGESAGLQLSDVKMAKFERTSTGETNTRTVWYRTFTPGGKALRMLGGLPNDEGLTLHLTSSEGPGQLKYRLVKDEEPVIFKVGYLKEMMNAVREKSAAK